EAGRAGQQDVVDRLSPPPGRLQDDLQVALQLALTHELVKGAGPQADLGGELAVEVVLGQVGAEELFPHRRATASRARASFRRMPTSPSWGSSEMTSRISASV